MRIFGTPHGPLFFYLVFLAIQAFWYLLGWPIMVGDTDLWYHLTSGRYFAEYGCIPSESFFSFLEPPRHWVNYFWLFQVIVYRLHEAGGYMALLWFRAGAYMLLLAIVGAYLFAGVPEGRLRAWPMLWFVCYCLTLIVRFQLVRPHMMTYVSMAAFLYLLEYHPRRAVWLVPLGVLWCNLHGIAFPVLLLICGAYVYEYFILRLTGRRYDSKLARQFLVPTTLAMLAIFATPHGLELLQLPFTSMAFAKTMIQELQPITFSRLSSWTIFTMVPSAETPFNFILVAAIILAITSVFQRHTRVSHVLLLAGGLALLSRGGRFVVECALLALPLLKANRLQVRSMIPRAAHLCILGLLLMGPVGYLKHPLPRPRYPYSERGLPAGISTFLTHVDVGGRVMNDPNDGGYLQWRLYPRYRILMDMETPFMFTDEDLYRGATYTSESTFQRYVDQYRPHFVAVPLSRDKFPKVVAKFPDYRVVWFDDTGVLYADRRQLPELVETYELQGIDPFELVPETGATLLRSPDRGPKIEQIARMARIDPACLVTNVILAAAHSDEQEYERSMPFARAAIRHYPESYLGYWVLADAQHGLGLHAQSVAAFQSALARQPTRGDRRAILQHLARAHAAQGHYEQAFVAQYRAVADTLFDPVKTSVEELYDLEQFARAAGRMRKAGALLVFLEEFRLMPGDEDWKAKLRKEWARVGLPPSEPFEELATHE